VLPVNDSEMKILVSFVEDKVRCSFRSVFYGLDFCTVNVKEDIRKRWIFASLEPDHSGNLWRPFSAWFKLFGFVDISKKFIKPIWDIKDFLLKQIRRNLCDSLPI